MQVRRQLEAERGGAAGSQEIAGRMQLPGRKVRIIKRAVRAFSAPTQSASDEAGGSLSDTLPDKRVETPEVGIFSRSESETIQKMLDALDERESTILRLRYGLTDEEPMTLKNIGERIGLTRDRVRPLEGAAVRQLERTLPGPL